MTRLGRWLFVGGITLWILSPLLWFLGDLSLSTSLFIGSTALLPFLIYIGVRKDETSR